MMMAIMRKQGPDRGRDLSPPGVASISDTPRVRDAAYFQDGDGQIIFPVASLSGHTTTGSPFCIWWV